MSKVRRSATSSRELARVVGLLYDSVLDDASWPPAMASLAEFAQARGSFYFVADQRRNAIVHSELAGVDPAANEQYLQYYGTKDPRLVPALKFGVGEGFTEEALLEWRRLTRSEVFADLLRPFDIPRIFGVWLRKRPEAASAFIFERSFRQGALERADQERCAIVIPHLARAVRVREAATAVRQHTRIYMDYLDRLPFGTILLDSRGRVIVASAAARRQLADGHTILYAGGRVQATRREADRRLQRMIRGAMTAGTKPEEAGGSLTMRGVSPRSLLRVLVLPVRRADLLAESTVTAMLLTFEPKAPPAAAETLKITLRLSRAEALLASTLATGVTLREAADRLRLSINTCKSQLKSIYAKTGYRNHVDLSKIVLLAESATSRSLIKQV